MTLRSPLSRCQFFVFFKQGIACSHFEISWNQLCLHISGFVSMLSQCATCDIQNFNGCPWNLILWNRFWNVASSSKRSTTNIVLFCFSKGKTMYNTKAQGGKKRSNLNAEVVSNIFGLKWFHYIWPRLIPIYLAEVDSIQTHY